MLRQFNVNYCLILLYFQVPYKVVDWLCFYLLLSFPIASFLLLPLAAVANIFYIPVGMLIHWFRREKTIEDENRILAKEELRLLGLNSQSLLNYKGRS
jgi:hypothetical protein